jgi:polyhydroxyalkanoate synthase subunit PhaC
MSQTMRSSLLQQLPYYWFQGTIWALDGWRRGFSEPYPLTEDPAPTTPYTVIYEGGKVRLRYYPPARQTQTIPLLVVYALIKRPFILDLQPGRSVVENLTQQGFALYLLDWIPPTRADSWRGFDAYVNVDVDNAVRATQDHAGVERLSLLGYCFGGLLATIYTALYPQAVQNLLTLNLPLDLSVRQIPLFTFLTDKLSPHTVDLITTTYGNCPAWFVNAGFTALAPIHHSLDKYVGLYRNSEKEGYAAMFGLVERWMNSDVPLAGTIFREAVLDLFQQNLLAHNRLRVGGQVVNLHDIRCSVLNIVGEQDDVVHPQSSLPFINLVSGHDKHTLSFPTGHIGAVISGLAHKRLWPQVGTWLRDRDHTTTYGKK